MKKNSLNRRDFIGMTVAGSAALFTNNFKIQANPQQFVGVRKEISSLTAEEIKAFKSVVDVMMRPKNIKSYQLAVNEIQEYQRWYFQANIHLCWCPHGDWFFLPWHRAYIYYFEKICRQILGDQTFMLPYWDWTQNPQVPSIFWEAPLLWKSREVKITSVAAVESVGKKGLQCQFGNNVDPTIMNDALCRLFRNPDFYLIAGKGFSQQCPPTECPPTKPRPKDLPENARYPIQDCSNINKGNMKRVTGKIEAGPHNYIHKNFIGGTMTTNYAPYDPIFWVHHANIDRIWAKWLQLYPTNIPCDFLNLKVGEFYDTDGNPVWMKVSELIDTYQLGYRYFDQPENSGEIKCSDIQSSAPIGFFISNQINKMVEENKLLTVDFLTSPQRLNEEAKSYIKAITQNNKSITKKQPTLRLTVELEKPKDPDVSVMFFMNAKQNISSKSVNNQAYIGEINFFGLNHHHTNMMHMKEESINFFLDINPTIQKLIKANQFTTLEESTLSILSYFPKGKNANKKAEITLKSIKMEVIIY